MTPTELLEYVRARCVECAGCWIWQGCVQQCGTPPAMRIPGSRKTTSVRRAVLAVRGVDLTGKLASNTCESPLCVAPEHLKAMTRKELQQRTGKALPLPSRIRRNTATAERMRAKSTLDWDKVAAIRSSDLPMRTLAAQYNVTMHTIWNIKRGKTWVERSAATNPIAQLFAA